MCILPKRAFEIETRGVNLKLLFHLSSLKYNRVKAGNKRYEQNVLSDDTFDISTDGQHFSYTHHQRTSKQPFIDSS